MNALSRTAVLALIAFGGAAHAAVLYKSVSPTGGVEFSDTRPDDREGVERIAGLSAGAARRRDEASYRGLDEAVMRANDQLDLAEHALAVARHSPVAPPDLLRFGERRFTAEHIARVAYCRKYVLNARPSLHEADERHHQAAAVTACALD